MCCFSLWFRDLPWGCQLCFDSQIGWEIPPVADSDIFFPCQGKSLTVISSVACQKGICLLLVKVPALYLFPLFGFLFLFHYVFCTQGFSSSQGKPHLDLSHGTPRLDFWSLMIISLLPPCPFPPTHKWGGVREAAPRTRRHWFLCKVWPHHTRLWGRGPPWQLYL